MDWLPVRLELLLLGHKKLKTGLSELRVMLGPVDKQYAAMTYTLCLC